MINQLLLEELRLILEEDYGLMLKPQELLEVGISLISFFETLAMMENQGGNEYGQG